MKKKLLFLIHALNAAGAQKVLVRLVNALDPEKYDITIKTIYRRHELKSELNDNIKLESIIQTNNFIIVRLLGFLLRRVIPVKLSARFLVGEDYDYQISYLEGESTKILSGSRLPKERKIAWVHVNLLRVFQSQNLYKDIDHHKKAYQSYGKIICVSDGVRDSVYERFGKLEDVSVLYNVIDEAQLVHLASKQDVDLPDTFNILMVGNCRMQKGYERMLSTARRLINENYKFHITVCGNGTEFQRLLELKHNYGLDETIDMIGQTDNPYAYMKQADMLLCTSFDEGFSTVVVEALLLGLPTLTTDCSGMSEILDNGKYGIIVENNEDCIYEGIKSVLENPSILKHYRDLLPERKTFFSKTECIRKIESLFE